MLAVVALMDVASGADRAVLGLQLAGALLSVSPIVFLLGGISNPVGTRVRLLLQPGLTRIRAASPLSRAELADATIVLSMAFALLAAFLDTLVAVGLVALLWWSRPAVRRLTSDDDQLLALAGTWSIDLLIGLYAPMVVGQLLVGRPFMAASLSAAIVALSWPAGGGFPPGRRRRPVPIPAG